MNLLDAYNCVLCGNVQDIEFYELVEVICVRRTKVLQSRQQKVILSMVCVTSTLFCHQLLL